MSNGNGALATIPTLPLPAAAITPVRGRMSSTIRCGVVGYGYWGPNIVRNLQGMADVDTAAVCDKSPAARKRAHKAHPQIYVTSDVSEIMTSPEIDAVAIVTPVWTHFELAKTALENGKHVFVEKPFTSSVAQAEALIELAEKNNLTIMVDHTFLFTGAVKKIKQLVDEQLLGKLYYYDSTRVNLGLFQHDINVVWDLAPHDLSILDYVIGSNPEAISATGQKHLNGHEDIAFITLYFPDSIIAHVNVNWLSPVKVRTTMIGGEKRMLLWNDLEADEKIKIYDKGVDMNSREGVYELLVSYRSGDMWAPHLEQAEALKHELSHFIKCIGDGSTPINDGEAGLRIVRMLEASTQSLKDRGALVYL
jgi:predicted dehydrogenase